MSEDKASPVPQVSTSLPIPSASPANIALRSWLHGGPGDKASSVIEIGCGGGEHLIPLAFYSASHQPGARYLGVEPDPDLLQRARDRAAAAGVTNVEFAAEPPGEGPFDVVLVRGAVGRDDDRSDRAFMALAARLVAPQGLVYIDYPVLPGAGMDALVGALVHALPSASEGPDGTRKAATAMKEIIAQPSHPYPNLIALELATMSAGTLSDGELARRYPPSPSFGRFFRDVARIAAEAGLQFLCEAEREESSVFEALRVELMSRGASGAALEQAIDILCYRRSRASIFCRADVHVADRPGIEALDRLLIASPLVPLGSAVRLGPGIEEPFAAPEGGRIGSVDPLLKASLLALRDAWPKPISFAKLMGEAVALLHKDGAEGAPDDELVAGVAQDLWTLHARGLVDLHLVEPSYAPKGSTKLHALARMEAAGGEGLTTPYHTLYVPKGFDAALVRHMNDPELTDEDITGALMGDIMSGSVPLELGGQRINDPALLEPIVKALMTKGRAALARWGLLE